MANHPNRNKMISGTGRFVAGECIRQHDMAHNKAMSLGNERARERMLDVAAQWSLAADRVTHSQPGTLRVVVGQSTYTLTITA